MIQDPINLARAERDNQTAALKRDLVPEALAEKQTALAAELASVNGEIKSRQSIADTWNRMFSELDSLVARAENLAVKVGRLEHVLATAPERSAQYLGIDAYDSMGADAVQAEIQATLEIKVIKRVQTSVRKELTAHLERMKQFALEHDLPSDIVPTADSPRYSGLVIPNPSEALLEATIPTPPKGHYTGLDRHGRHTWANQ